MATNAPQQQGPAEPPAISHKFPPFPKPPSGVIIPAFSEFKPTGIQIVLDPDSDNIERNGRYPD